jgi:hypothetical protein
MTMVLSPNAADLMRPSLVKAIIRLHNDPCFTGEEKRQSNALLNNPATSTQKLMNWKTRLLQLQAERPRQPWQSEPWQADEVYASLTDACDLPDDIRLTL